MGNNLLTQVILIVTALVIMVTFIRPSFEVIATTQDDILRFESIVSQASQINDALQDLIRQEQRISTAEMERLRIYLPANIDDALIMRDVENIFDLADIPLSALSTESDEVLRQPASAQVEQNSEMAPNETTVIGEGVGLVFKDFNMTFFAEYEQLTTLLQALEQNAYPLEIVELTFSGPNGESSSIEGVPEDVFSYTMTLRAFALGSAE